MSEINLDADSDWLWQPLASYESLGWMFEPLVSTEHLGWIWEPLAPQEHVDWLCSPLMPEDQRSGAPDGFDVFMILAAFGSFVTGAAAASKKRTYRLGAGNESAAVVSTVEMAVLEQHPRSDSPPSTTSSSGKSPSIDSLPMRRSDSDSPPPELRLQQFSAAVPEPHRRPMTAPARVAASDEPASYADIPCTAQNVQDVGTLITKLSKGRLAVYSSPILLTNIGHRIAHLHSLKFLGIIFSNHVLKSKMKSLMKGAFKSDFMGPLSQNLTHLAPSLEKHLPDFCAHVNADLDTVRGHVEKRSWQGLVNYLIRC